MAGLCSICQERFGPGKISALKCGHTYHLHCISQWLETNASCPVCRISVNPSTGIIEQLYFDYGEDGSDIGSSVVPASVHVQLAKKVTRLEGELQNAKTRSSNVRKAKKKANKEVNKLVNRLRAALTTLNCEKRSFKTLERKYALLATEKNNLEGQLTKYHSIERLLNDAVEETDDVGVEMNADSFDALRLSFGILKKKFRIVSAKKNNFRRRLKILKAKNSAQKTELDQLKDSLKKSTEEAQRLRSGSNTVKAILKEGYLFSRRVSFNLDDACSKPMKSPPPVLKVTPPIQVDKL